MQFLFKILFVFIFLPVVANANCLSQKDQDVIRNRLFKDTIYFVKKDCNLKDENLQKYIDTMYTFLDFNDAELRALFKRVYGNNSDGKLKSFITDNANRNATKVFYNKTTFCKNNIDILQKIDMENISNSIRQNTDYKIAGGC